MQCCSRELHLSCGPAGRAQQHAAYSHVQFCQRRIHASHALVRALPPVTDTIVAITHCSAGSVLACVQDLLKQHAACSVPLPWRLQGASTVHVPANMHAAGLTARYAAVLLSVLRLCAPSYSSSSLPQRVTSCRSMLAADEEGQLADSCYLASIILPAAGISLGTPSITGYATPSSSQISSLRAASHLQNGSPVISGTLHTTRPMKHAYTNS